MSLAEDALVRLLSWTDAPPPQREVVFAPPRRWRFDLAWPDALVACEVEGGGWVAGRHNRGAGAEADMVKYNTAAILGWLVLRVTPAQIDGGQAVAWIVQALAARQARP